MEEGAVVLIAVRPSVRLPVDRITKIGLNFYDRFKIGPDRKKKRPEKSSRWHFTHRKRSRVCVKVRCPSVCPDVRPFDFPSMGPQQQTCSHGAAVGPVGRRTRSVAARPALSSSGVRMRAVPRCQRTYEAEHRLV